MKNSKWGTESNTDRPIYVVLFCSRNKDNKDIITDFKERRKSFITTKTPEELYGEFYDFVDDGQESEMCRMYYSVNARDMNKVYKKFLHFLIDNPDFNLCYAASKIAGIAAKHENSLTKRWMFDFDNVDRNLAEQFCDEIKLIDAEVRTEIKRTPHGFAIICNRGFDIRGIDFDKWNFVTLKKDDMLCTHWWTKCY
jgi:hypothetical protein